MAVLEAINKAGLIPVVVFDHVENAVPAAKALLDGGLEVMEITLRTDAGIEAIKEVRRAYPQMILGAGTVLSVEKAQASVEAGAQFIVSPGLNPEVVEWCIQNKIVVTPGCVTPTEIDRALAYGIKTVKFFPNNIYGGIKACQALYGPYRSAGIRFIPTGGVDNDNLADYADKPFIHAVGGSWLCDTAHLKEHNFNAITATVKKAIDILLGFEFAHVGLNTQSAAHSQSIVEELSRAFHLAVKMGNSSNFAGSGIEVWKGQGPGEHGHIAIKTNNMTRAIHYLQKRGFTVDMDTAKYKGDSIAAVYLTGEIGGFAVHLVQK